MMFVLFSIIVTAYLQGYDFHNYMKKSKTYIPKAINDLKTTTEKISGLQITTEKSSDLNIPNPNITNNIPESYFLCNDPIYNGSEYYCQNLNDENVKWYISHPTCAYIGIAIIGILFLCLATFIIKKFLRNKKNYKIKNMPLPLTPEV